MLNIDIFISYTNIKLSINNLTLFYKELKCNYVFDKYVKFAMNST